MQNTKISPKEDITLLKAVSENNIEIIQKLIEDPLKINKIAFEEAILLAAYKKNSTIFNLLEDFVSRTTHRKAYYILNKK